MKWEKIFRSPGIISAITILLLLSSYIFIIIHNYVSATSGEISFAAKFFVFLTLLFLFLFLASFVLFLIAMFHIVDIKEIFQNPTKISVMSAILLLCSFLSSVMNSAVAKVYGELAAITKIFFYLALVFSVFFIVCFFALIVSFSNKFFYSKKL